MITDLLNYSRSSRGSINTEQIDLAIMANGIITDLKLHYRFNEYNVTVGDCMPVSADASLMRIVLDNLLGNAFKYTAKVESPRIEFGETSIYGNRVFYVKDNGAGFDMAKAADLFTPFVRLHNDSQFAGTGVGLSSVKRIIERHGGEIWAESQPMQGSTFFFSIGDSAAKTPISGEGRKNVAIPD